MTASHLDPARVRRALSLDVTELADSQYLVSGGASEHVVHAGERPWTCDCRDAVYRPDLRCKHTTAVYFDRQLDGRVRDALRTAVGAA